MTTKIPKTIRIALVEALRQRYNKGSKAEKSQILEEFVAVSGYHRKSAIRILKARSEIHERSSTSARPRLYDDAVRQALTVLWEASDRVCGKRLHALLPMLIPALERHGHLQLDSEVREKLTSISAASIDRVLREVRSAGPPRQRKRAVPAVSRKVPVRTFADWHEPPPGYMEMDLVAHCGERMGGSFVHTLTLTDVASGWTECLPLLVRESSLVVESLETVRGGLPFTLQGLDVDNGSEFVNDTLLHYCARRGIEFTRSRPYHKNDQAWIEQKNGSVVRRLVGHRRLEGVAAAEALMRLYAAARLFVNFFQPSFKLKEKVRTGSRVSKRYHPPQTPCARLVASDTVPEQVKTHLHEVSEQIDPLELLDEIRTMQQRLAALANGDNTHTPTAQKDDISRFLAGLATAWHGGEIRPTHQVDSKPARHWRTREDPFETAWPKVCEWLNSDPDQTAKALFQRLQHDSPGVFHDGQLRTLQRRLKDWRRHKAHELVFGVNQSEDL